MKDRQINILLSVLSGVLAFLAFPPLKIGLAAWVCLVPLLVAVKRSGFKSAFSLGFMSGTVFFSTLLYWLVNVTVPGTVILVLVLAVFFGLFALLAGIIFKYSMDLLILPFVWVVLEFIRSHLFTGFPWGLLGYSQYTNINLIQVADLTGVYGVSFALAAFNVAAFAIISRSKRKIYYMMSALLFLVAVTTYGIYRQDDLTIWGSPRISVVQGNIPQEFKWDPAKADDTVGVYAELTKKAVMDKPDMVIWPETAYPYLAEEGAVAKDVAYIAGKTRIPILAGMVYKEGEDYYNSAVLFSKEGKVSDVYFKTHLVPFGEYVPFEEYFPFLRKHIDKPIGAYSSSDEYTLFRLGSVEEFGERSGAITRTTLFYRFGVLICFEDIFPYITREFVLKGANFVVNMTNDAWFKDTAATEQHLQSSVFRAVENRVPVIRAANTGVSCFIDPTGRILLRVEEGGKDTCVRGFATHKVNVTRTRSFYTVYGDVFAYFCMFMMILLIVAEKFSNPKLKGKE